MGEEIGGLWVGRRRRAKSVFLFRLPLMILIAFLCDTRKLSFYFSLSFRMTIAMKCRGQKINVRIKRNNSSVLYLRNVTAIDIRSGAMVLGCNVYSIGKDK